jgi:TolB-like protein/tetratricopeptide (TPR) repeat protein
VKTLLQEFKRRQVYRVTVVYVVVSWVLLQAAEALFPAFGIPDVGMRILALALAFLFPVVMLLTWAFELTPAGIKVTHSAQPHEQVRINARDYIVGILLVVLLGMMGVQLLNSTSRSPVAGYAMEPGDDAVNLATPVPGFSGRAAIAVLPFVNMSEDPAQDYFADGITEDLITGLQSFQSFPIIARTSTFTYKNTDLGVPAIAEELGAGYVIEGSVRKVGDDVRINVQLIDAQGQHVWAEMYDFEFEDVLSIQSELVSKILLAIEPELIITEADRTRFVRTEDMEAFDYFLRATTNTFVPWGWTDLNGREVTPERLEMAREYALKAVELDPGFAAGWRLLNHIDGSYIVNLAYLFTAEEMMDILERAIEYGERSRQLSPFEPTVCSCLAAMLVMNGDVEEALLLQEESLRLNPSNAIARAVMAKLLHLTGDRGERPLHEINIAKRLSPQDLAMSSFLYFEAEIHQSMGRFDDAVAAAKQAALLAPNNYDAHYVKVTALYASGQRELARQAVMKLSRDAPADFKPSSAWDVEFPAAVAANIELQSGESLANLSYNEGLRRVFEDLGWPDQTQ